MVVTLDVSKLSGWLNADARVASSCCTQGSVFLLVRLMSLLSLFLRTHFYLGVIDAPRIHCNYTEGVAD